MEQNQEGIMERQGSCLLLRCASQNSLDESSQKHISQNHPHSKERPPYRNHLHTQKAFDVMNVMRKQRLLCDVTLVADTVEIPAHKMVLAACSPYFFAMFSSFEESRQDRIVLQEVDHQALLLLVEYVYTSEVQVTEENVQVLLPAANLLQLTDVRDACCDFLQSQLHPTNCLGIRAFADLHGCLELLSHAESYIELHFPQMDIHVRYFDYNKRRVETGVYNSVFMSHTAAEDILQHFLNGIRPLQPNRILQISMDGPNVNRKFLRLFKESQEITTEKKIIHIGSCGLHIIHGAFQTGHKAAK
ncbi:hypothetical protein NQ314_015226 [Rhamnusium bicolor]|uniref:BTB domain-containing protein n=1 Tax=Rhamnusium bicolor TaxID=1586634 RepID=A0AAV8WZE7_9CUCU|nr:hypothetical protein NQ314_015226 [Rhamnusium bicolor]